MRKQGYVEGVTCMCQIINESRKLGKKKRKKEATHLRVK